MIVILRLPEQRPFRRPHFIEVSTCPRTRTVTPPVAAVWRPRFIEGTSRDVEQTRELLPRSFRRPHFIEGSNMQSPHHVMTSRGRFGGRTSSRAGAA